MATISSSISTAIRTTITAIAFRMDRVLLLIGMGVSIRVKIEFFVKKQPSWDDDYPCNCSTYILGQYFPVTSNILVVG